MEDLKLELKCLDATMVNLLGAFIWEHSKEGHEYWSDVFDKLEHYRNLAKDENDE